VKPPWPNVGDVAIRPVLERLTNAVVDCVVRRVGEKLDQRAVRRSTQDLYRKVLALRRVKTFLSMERAANLETFYVPPHVERPDGRTRVSTIEETFGDAKHVLIQGILGLGKSILMRHLAIRELQIGRRVPVFLQLGRLNYAGSNASAALRDMVEKELGLLGLQHEQKAFPILADAQMVVLLLDGFDEVHARDRVAARAALEDMTRRYPSVPILVSARPHTGMEGSNPFTTFDLSLLAPGEYREILGQLALPDEAERIAKDCEKGRARGVSSLLVTPLLVTLVTAFHRRRRRIPHEVAELFDQLLDVFLVEHDALTGKERPRTCGLRDDQIKELFEAFCFLTRRETSSSFAQREAYEYAARAAKVAKLDCDHEAALNDVREITCLLLREGRRWSFLHQSLQEFHCARYMKTRSAEDPQRFYAKMLRSGNRRYWPELYFLAQIDRYNYLTYYATPCLEALARSLQVDLEGDHTFTSAGLARFLKTSRAALFVWKPPVAEREPRIGLHKPPDWGRAALDLVRELIVRLQQHFLPAIAANPELLRGCPRTEQRGGYSYPIHAFYRDVPGEQMLLDSIQQVVAHLRREYRAVYRYCEAEEGKDDWFFESLG